MASFLGSGDFCVNREIMVGTGMDACTVLPWMAA